ncbi:unnamed protein product [Fusarium graminearum]|nr:unnamed protein product [Fusarium graminearum]VTO84414.1 unnamed protein product [Fusarium graminearum]
MPNPETFAEPIHSSVGQCFGQCEDLAARIQEAYTRREPSAALLPQRGTTMVPLINQSLDTLMDRQAPLQTVSDMLRQRSNHPDPADTDEVSDAARYWAAVFMAASRAIDIVRNPYLFGFAIPLDSEAQCIADRVQVPVDCTELTVNHP